ncbi:MAG: hypothetical protein H0U65_13645 [Rubrobacter sp.]|jgi:hypothetical protein|nr:hypothetical protein [Rubrobacter sp.]
MSGRWTGFSAWLGANPVPALIAFIALNVVGAFGAEFLGGVAGTLFRSILLFAGILIAFGFLSGRWGAGR